MVEMDQIINKLPKNKTASQFAYIIKKSMFIFFKRTILYRWNCTVLEEIAKESFYRRTE